MREIVAANVAAFLEELRQQYPGFQLRTKAGDSRRCTTWGSCVYVPSTWEALLPSAQWIRLHHEAVHLAQFQTLGSWRFGFRYATFAGRFALEAEAFAQEMAAFYEVYGADALRAKQAFYAEQLSGRAYYWCASTRDAEAWATATCEVLCVGHPA